MACSVNCDVDRLETLLFNPTERPELCNPLSSHLDPDSNFLTRLPSSKYLVEEETNNRFASVNNIPSFSIMHLNTRSLLGNSNSTYWWEIYKYHSLLSAFPKLGFKNDTTSELVNVTGYNFVSNHRK